MGCFDAPCTTLIVSRLPLLSNRAFATSRAPGMLMR
jgi:hypothetical protein